MSYLPVPGERIRDYEILGRIGAGGMGVVFNARDLKLDRVVALKFLSAKLTYTADEKRGLLQEARLISALDHPNICTIYNVEERTLDDYGEQLFIVMGYYDGGSLADHIGAGPMLLPDILDLLTGIAAGLSAAHARRVVHRDIKPSNILLTRESLVKIVDFGLAKIVSSSSQTQSADTSGTLAYMAPEQISGAVVDQRADIWAVGVLAAEMVSGIHPFKRDNLAATAFAICHDAPRVSQDAPIPLQQIIYKCLSKDPGLRYQSCEELLEDLRPLRTDAANLPAIERVDGAHGKGPGSGSHRSGSHGSQGRNAAAVGWLTEKRAASTQRRALEKSIEAASGSRGQRQGRGWWWIAAAVVVVALIILAVPSLRERTAGVLLSPSEKHIAVLPFDNLDVKKEDGKGAGETATSDAVAGGLMDSMTGALSNLDGDQKSLWVVPSTVVRSQHVDD
ncbi:MAG TPA: serine/threonine-protein kinase, partial [Acidisarcina sp.]